MKLSERIEKLIKALQKDVYEKDEIFSLSLLALLSGESIFLIGLPGVAKSLVARRIKSVIKDGKKFEYLMNKFSTPEEIFGPIDILELEKGNYIRKIEDYLPDAHVAFLDEIWKAGPAIQNTLLTIINERIYKNGKNTINVPLKLLIAASNEYPAAKEGLEALYDRFMIRYVVKSIEDEDNFYKLLNNETKSDVNISPDLVFTTKEIQDHIAKINNVQIGKIVFKFIIELKKRLENVSKEQIELDPKSNGIYISDRRWKKAANLIKASAYYNDRSEVALQDLPILTHTLWDVEDDKEKIEYAFNESIVKSIGTGDFDYEISKIESHFKNFSAKFTRSKTVFDEVDKIVDINGSKHYEYRLHNNPSNVWISTSHIDNATIGTGFNVQLWIGQTFNQKQLTNSHIIVKSPRSEITYGGSYPATRLTESVSTTKIFKDESYSIEKEDEIKRIKKELLDMEKKIEKNIDEINGAANVFLGDSFKRTIKFAFRESSAKISDLLEDVEHELALLTVSKKKK